MLQAFQNWQKLSSLVLNWGSIDLLAKTTPKVRVPEERIKMYTKYAVPPNTHKQYPEGIHKLAGPFDIALIKLKARVTLMPGRVVPVGFLFFLVGQILFLYLHCAGLPGPHQGPRSVGISTRVFSYLFSSSNQINKGTGYSESTGKVMKDLWGRGTSKSSNELKSWPQPPCQLRLIKIYFLRHNISHLWLKMAIVWPFLAYFCRFFALPTTFMGTLNSKCTSSFL